jgi:hypothetical protein
VVQTLLRLPCGIHPPRGVERMIARDLAPMVECLEEISSNLKRIGIMMEKREEKRQAEFEQILEAWVVKVKD